MADYFVRYLPSPAALNSLHGRPGVKLVKRAHDRFEATRLVTATSDQGAVREILAEGGTPLEIKRHRRTLLNTEIITKAYKRAFLTALAFNVEAGMSAGRALRLVIENEPNPAKQIELMGALNILIGGGDFSEAIDAIGFFDRATIAILIAGEKTGSLRQALMSAVEHNEARDGTTKTIFGMFAFVIFDLFTVVSMAFGVQFTFIPMMRKQGIESTNPQLIEAFNRKLELGATMNGALLWIAVLISIIVGVFVYLSLNRSTRFGKETVEKMVNHTPLLKSFFLNTAMAESFGVAATMLAGGVRFNETIEVARYSTSSPAMKRYWDTVHRRMMMGDAVARAMHQPPLSSTEYQIIASHRSTAQLTKVVRDISSERAEQATSNAKTINRALLFGSMGYAAASVLIYIWLLFVQNEQTLSALK